MPIKITMKSLDNIYEYYAGKLIIIDFMTNKEILEIDNTDFQDLKEFIKFIEYNENKLKIN